MVDDEVAQLEDELQKARQDLTEDLRQVNRKVEETFSPEIWVERNPLVAAASAGGVGFVVGLASDSWEALLTLALGAVLGFSLHRSWRGPPHDSSDEVSMTNGTK